MIKFHKLTEGNKPEVGRSVLVVIDKWGHYLLDEHHSLSIDNTKPRKPYFYVVNRNEKPETYFLWQNDELVEYEEDFYTEDCMEEYGGFWASEISGWIYLDELEYKIEEE